MTTPKYTKNNEKIIKLCSGCIKDLEQYNPYIIPISIEKVSSIKKCENYIITHKN